VSWGTLSEGFWHALRGGLEKGGRERVPGGALSSGPLLGAGGSSGE
jgi:hypothetical protein